MIYFPLTTAEVTRPMTILQRLEHVFNVQLHLTGSRAFGPVVVGTDVDFLIDANMLPAAALCFLQDQCDDMTRVYAHGRNESRAVAVFRSQQSGVFQGVAYYHVDLVLVHDLERRLNVQRNIQSCISKGWTMPTNKLARSMLWDKLLQAHDLRIPMEASSVDVLK